MERLKYIYTYQLPQLKDDGNNKIIPITAISDIATTTEHFSETILLVGCNDARVVEVENWITSIEVETNINVIVIPDTCKLEDIYNISIIFNEHFKKYWNITLLRNIVNLPLYYNNEHIYYTRMVYIIPPESLSRLGKKVLWNTSLAIEGVTEVVIISDIPNNFYLLRDLYQSGMLLYSNLLKGNRYFKDKSINKGNISKLLPLLHTMPL